MKNYASVESIIQTLQGNAANRFTMIEFPEAGRRSPILIYISVMERPNSVFGYTVYLL